MIPLKGQRLLPLAERPADRGRNCIACGSSTIVVASGAHAQPVERCTECGVERALPAKSRRLKGARPA